MQQWPVCLIHRSVDSTIKWEVLMHLRGKNPIQEEILVKEVKISKAKILLHQKIFSTLCSSAKNRKIVVKEGRTIASNKETTNLSNKMKQN